jgi:hypothetical protein
MSETRVAYEPGPCPSRLSQAPTIAAEALMNNVGEEGISEGFRLAKSERAVPGGVGAEGPCHPVSVQPFSQGLDDGRVGLLGLRFRAAFPEFHRPVPRGAG